MNHAALHHRSASPKQKNDKSQQTNIPTTHPRPTVMQRTRMPQGQEVRILQAMAGNQAVGRMLSGQHESENAPTSLPRQLKDGIEHMAGVDMSDVKVHANSQKPSQVGALAYTTGNDIYLQPGQERHLPHEAWHAVQQKTGRVQPTTQLAGVAINDDASLEKEADVMGARALQAKPAPNASPLQRVEATEDDDLIQAKMANSQPVVQLNAWDAISGGLRDALDNPVGPTMDPIETIFDSVVATNRAMATSIAIPGNWLQIVGQFAAAHPADGLILLAALGRLPGFYRGGWIMSLQPRAAAMTLDHSIFVPRGRTLSLDTYIHELVHVFQCGVVGVSAFLVSYFGMSAATIAYRWLRGQPTNPMRSSPHENQAYNLEARFVTWYRSQHGSHPNSVRV